ncbi:MAG: hypothetical protein HYX78_09135, partial [Armatimonadetes bacterium]|nr:hypothetical protein [Armatimonadota bacterium]
ACSSNLKQITQAWLSYLDDYGQRTPPYFNALLPYPPWVKTILPWPGSQMKLTDSIIGSYIKSINVCLCPERTTRIYHNSWGFYGYNAVYLVMNGIDIGMWDWTTSVVTASMIQVPSKTICFVDDANGVACSPRSRVPWPGWNNSTALGNRHNNGWNASFCDGHVKWFGESSQLSKNDYLWALNKTNYRR